MRYRAPPRDAVVREVFDRPPLCEWAEYHDLLDRSRWPTIDELNELRPPGSRWRFAAQTPELLADGLHYEQRIAEQAVIATRVGNWHDLFNALVWLRHAQLKQVLNAQQVSEIARMGPKVRSRVQYALTHFDEAGVVVTLHDPGLLALWDAHDWYGLFWHRRAAWQDGTIGLELFGHALLEHALTPEKLLVGKAVVCLAAPRTPVARATAAATVARSIACGDCLRDPLELRPLPLSGIPGWRPDNAVESFHLDAACYQPRRPDRRYPPPLALA